MVNSSLRLHQCMTDTDSPIVDLKICKRCYPRLDFVPRKYMNLRTLSIILPFASESFPRKPFTNLQRRRKADHNVDHVLNAWMNLNVFSISCSLTPKCCFQKFSPPRCLWMAWQASAQGVHKWTTTKPLMTGHKIPTWVSLVHPTRSGKPPAVIGLSWKGNMLTPLGT